MNENVEPQVTPDTSCDNPPSHPPNNKQLARMDQVDMSRHFDRLSRKPFRDSLAQLLDCEPTPERLREYADEEPSKWAYMVGILAKLAGYGDRTLHLHGDMSQLYDRPVAELADSELVAEMQALDKQLAKLRVHAHTIEGELAEADTHESGHSNTPPGGGETEGS